MGEGRIEVQRLVRAPAHAVFAVLSDPRRHPELDGSGMLRAASTAAPVTGVGDEFVMELHAERLGPYRSRSVVVAHEPDHVIAWSPGPLDEEPFGHVYRYVLRARGPERTLVTQTYDWSAVSDPRLEGRLPLVSREALARTLDRLATVVETATGAEDRG